MTDNRIEIMARAIWTCPMRTKGNEGVSREWPPQYGDVGLEQFDKAGAAISALQAAGYAIVPVEINEAINDAINAAPCSNAEYYRAAIQASQGK